MEHRDIGVSREPQVAAARTGEPDAAESFSV